MKAIRVTGGRPELVETDLPKQGVRVRIAASSICGSDLHLMREGWVEGQILGHEFAGTTDDGSAVAVIPSLGCGRCQWCLEGYHSHCDDGIAIIGVSGDGGMAEYVRVPDYTLFPLPSGIPLANASLLEPLAVAAHGLSRARASQGDRVLVIGAGPIGLAAAAVLRGREMAFDVSARHPHQAQAAERLGGGTAPSGSYDLVVDAVGSSDSLAAAVGQCRPFGRIAMLGSFWQPARLDMSFCTREVELISATAYHRADFEEAGALLAGEPTIADSLITHRFPLEAAAEAFDTASDRAAGAIKVVFEP
jgi:threonine dehydrogenase-like Zn-dependent dehydrogenase